MRLLKSRGFDYKSALPELERRVKLVGLDADILKRYPIELSGGMKQRVVMVISTLLNPSLLIADEITSALDVSTQRAVGEMLLEFRARDFVKTTMVITHDCRSWPRSRTRSSSCTRASSPRRRRRTWSSTTRCTLTPSCSSPRSRKWGCATTSTRSSVSRPSSPAPQSPAGCRFRDRCPFAFDRCTDEPPFVEVKPGHSVACWLHADGVLPSEAFEPCWYSTM